MKPTETGYSSMDTTVTVVDDKGTADTSDDTTSQVVMPQLEKSMWSGVKVTPMPTTSAENINFDGTYYDVKTAEGTLHVIDLENHHRTKGTFEPQQPSKRRQDGKSFQPCASCNARCD